MNNTTIFPLPHLLGSKQYGAAHKAEKGRAQEAKIGGRASKMVHHHRYNQLRKGDEPRAFVIELENWGYCKRTRSRLLALLALALLSCSFVLAPLFFGSSTLYHLYSFAHIDANSPRCSNVSEGTICCDRSAFRTDICFMKGDVRTCSASSSVFLYTSRRRHGILEDDEAEENTEFQHEKIKPYTRKWETSVMDTVGEINLISKSEGLAEEHGCDVHHGVPAVFFSTAGYTGNLYHEFNDGIVPLYITSQHFRKRVVFVILEYRNWWFTKYGDVLSQLSDFPPIDFTGDNRTQCFPEAIVGLRIHGDLVIEPSSMEGNKTIVDFRNLLDRAYWPRIRGLIEEEKRAEEKQLGSSPVSRKPKLAIISRNDSRAIVNEASLVGLAEEIGFAVEVIRPHRRSELAQIYRSLNSSDVMVGVHGAAMTHLLYMRPGTVFIQIIPLGTDWAAETFYGQPAKMLGLKYVGYPILPRESSLYQKYDRNDPVLTNPKSVTQRGWEFTKKVYLDDQNVNLDLTRFRRRLFSAYNYSIRRLNRRSPLQPQ